MEEGDGFSDERAFRIYGQLMTAHKLCWEAGDTIFRAASTAGARDGARMQRYWRDLAPSARNGLHQLDFKAPAIAQARLGLPIEFFSRAYAPASVMIHVAAKVPMSKIDRRAAVADCLNDRSRDETDPPPVVAREEVQRMPVVADLRFAVRNGQP